ncbi:4,5-DOPA dioxygenase extradiol [Oxalobacteraceae bacterium R-40]|uniref:4,5-DOPA dioxygenase extradiol n=1 Tax=Keguizhuia sedimenti TaxID=3064264 RepID=A0ABU1BSJ9_9BURK|nr:4,5-DOPA dioxygenase extradiol [Oxalobacteraceae bacterium R-40]
MTNPLNIMPATFIGHGSPMNTLETNRFTAAWQELGRALPRPRAVLVISAHWFINSSAVTAMPNPRVIHDFYGFPKALFDFDYPAKGAPDVAEEIADSVRPEHVALDYDSWSLDHGTWSVLAHVFPKANIPVLQLSLHAGEELQYHFDLGKRLAPLRERGVFILGSGNVVHNLRLINWHLGDKAFDWATDFDAEVQKIMAKNPEKLVNIHEHAEYRRAVPTGEHFLPLAYLAGLASAAKQTPEVLVDGGAMGSLTMTSFVLGCAGVAAPTMQKASAPIPNPRDVPPQDTNI